MLETNYTRAVRMIADDIVRQIEDDHAPSRTYSRMTAGGDVVDTVRVFFADLPHNWHPAIPAGAARVALDLDPCSRRPAHECRVMFDAHDYDAGEAAADIAAAVLELIDNTAAYAR